MALLRWLVAFGVYELDAPAVGVSTIEDIAIPSNHVRRSPTVSHQRTITSEPTDRQAPGQIARTPFRWLQGLVTAPTRSLSIPGAVL
jgi:hypothetical protein